MDLEVHGLAGDNNISIPPKYMQIVLGPSTSLQLTLIAIYLTSLPQ